MDKVAKQFLNSLKCPICSAQIDMIKMRAIDFSNFACVNDKYHYNLYYQYIQVPFLVIQETVRIYDNNKLYEIFQSCDGSLSTEITVKDVDKEYRVLDKKKTLSFRYDKKLFDFSKSNRESILNRVKTILVFQ
ncbi:hypothetical protein UFOVP1290_365 [uncultured Caudovirales phage]|uniref:Uncharacterized protein n=1 Tax=uncultured Caudovirales phage TaxID=2100421 RepID=A0A6J5RX69_9CAUD|nr:hypothetical protein UFOVP1290_365 [uncultured Caudovirales phage]